MLTKKQRDLLLYIHETMSSEDIPPSFEEMKDALGLKSKSGIHRLISALVERGYLERLPHRARALRIKMLPDGSNPQDPTPVAASSFSQLMQDEIPLYGKIAAGTPIEAIRDEGTSVQIPNGFIGKGDHYALTIDGDSMINAGIHDQDTIIVKRCDSAENGQIAVALVDDSEATLKRIRREGKNIVLIPENDAYEERVLDSSRVKIQGQLVSLIRSYH